MQWQFSISPNSSKNYFIGVLSIYMSFLLNVIIMCVNEKF